ncbi:MAG: hypothetical protein R3B13_24750 [Polyangiaceae bacterium]
MSQGAAAADEDVVPDLPPLVRDADDELEGPAGDGDLELGALEVLEDAVEEDDALADFELGIDLGLGSETEAQDDAAEIQLDMSELLSRADEAETGADDDRSGPEQLDAAEGLSEPEESILQGDDGELHESLEDLVEGELPGIDADGEGDFEEADFGQLEFADEERPPEGPLAFEARRESEGDFSFATNVGMGVAALGRDLIFVRAGAAARAVVLPASGSALAALDDRVLVATVTGGLYFAHPDGRLIAVDGYGEQLASAVHRRSFAARLGASPSLITALLDSGALLSSEDGATTFRVHPTPRPVRALSPSGRWAADETRVFQVIGGQERALPEAATVAGAVPSLMEETADHVAVASAEAGVVLVGAGGSHAIAGTQGASALLCRDGLLWIGVGGSATQDAALLVLDLSTLRLTTALTLAGTRGETLTAVARSEQEGRLWLSTSAGLYSALPSPD